MQSKDNDAERYLEKLKSRMERCALPGCIVAVAHPALITA